MRSKARSSPGERHLFVSLAPRGDPLQTRFASSGTALASSLGIDVLLLQQPSGLPGVAFGYGVGERSADPHVSRLRGRTVTPRQPTDDRVVDEIPVGELKNAQAIADP